MNITHLLVLIALSLAIVSPASAQIQNTIWTPEEQGIIQSMSELSEYPEPGGLKKLFAISQKIAADFGENSKLFAESLFQITLFHIYDGNWEAAKAPMDQSLARYRSALEKADPYLALYLHSAADVYLGEEQSYHPTAEAYLREALKIRENAYSEPRTSLNGNRLTLAETLLMRTDVGSFDEAYRLLKKAKNDVLVFKLTEPQDVSRWYVATIAAALLIDQSDTAISLLDEIFDTEHLVDNPIILSNSSIEALIKLFLARGMSKEASALSNHREQMLNGLLESSQETEQNRSRD